MDKSKLPDLFGLAKTIDIRDYLESFYGMHFKASGHASCPLCGSKDNFSVSVKKQIVKCFGCMPRALGIVDMVMLLEKLSEHEAAKKICVDMGLIAHESDGLSAEERSLKEAEAKAQREKLKAERDAKREKEAKEAEKIAKSAKARMKEEAPLLLNAFAQRPDIKEEAKALIRWSDKMDVWYFDYIGWDAFHQSIAIVNQYKGEVFNIKHRQKWAWDTMRKGYIEGERSAGKWISTYGSTQHPFPLEYFMAHKDERVVISFGEKDALNLLSYDINTLTLGGISNSFEPFSDLFKDKVVYLWPDHQLIEYIAAMARYRELEGVAKEIFIVSFLHIDKTLPQKYDISDFILDRSFSDKEELLSKIEYSCFKLTNSFIEDVAQFFHEDEKLLERLDGFRSSAKSKKFRDIEADIIKVAKPVKSEMDEEINACESVLQQTRREGLLKEFQEFLSTSKREDAESFVQTFKLALDYKARLFNLFRKHHEVDATIAFVTDARSSGHELASYRERMYIWTGSHYQELSEKELKVFMLQKWMKAAQVNMKQQTPDFVAKVLEGVFYRSVPLERFKEEQNYRIINFDNGTAYLYNNGKFVFKNQHLKADAMTGMLPISYDPSATAPKWRRFLNEVLPDPIEQDALMEFIGYCFLNTHSYQKFLFLLGSGANGKSIVLNVIKKFFGREMTSNVDLQQLFSHELIGIENKYINIGSEINPKGLDKGQIENLKKLTAGESTQLNPKNATPYDISGGEIPKFIFSGNNKPQGNLDGGLFRRMLLLNFNRTISKAERIQSLEDRFEDEMSGIFNLAMDGLERLLKNGDFSLSSNMERALYEYQEEANPILAYVNENITMDKNVMVARKFLYAHYKKWAEERGHHSASERTFYSKLKDIIKEANDIQPSYNAMHHAILGNRPRFIENIKVEDSIIEDFNVDKHEIKTMDINVDVKLRVPIKHFGQNGTGRTDNGTGFGTDRTPMPSKCEQKNR